MRGYSVRCWSSNRSAEWREMGMRKLSNSVTFRRRNRLRLRVGLGLLNTAYSGTESRKGVGGGKREEEKEERERERIRNWEEQEVVGCGGRSWWPRWSAMEVPRRCIGKCHRSSLRLALPVACCLFVCSMQSAGEGSSDWRHAERAGLGRPETPAPLHWRVLGILCMDCYISPCHFWIFPCVFWSSTYQNSVHKWRCNGWQCAFKVVVMAASAHECRWESVIDVQLAHKPYGNTNKQIRDNSPAPASECLSSLLDLPRRASGHSAASHFSWERSRN